MYERGGKIRILFAIPRFSAGGAEKLLVHQLASLDRTRFTPSLITLFDERKDTISDKVSIARCLHFSSTFDIPAFFRLYAYIRHGQFDVVVTHLFSANLLVRAAAILARVRVLMSYEHNIYPDKRAWQIFADKLFSHWTEKIIVDSEAARLFTAQQESIPLEKFRTLFIPPLLERRNPKDPQLMRKELGIEPESLVVGVVSRLIPDKGHRYLIDAAKQILARFPKTYFLIVGWGHAKEQLQAQIETLGIGDRVKLTGRMDIQDVLPLIDIYVEPAVSTDLPIALMEAMRESKPIVATRIGDIPVFIEDAKTGFIVEPANAEELAERIGILLADASLRAALGRAAKKKVEEYSLANYMRAFEGLVEAAVLRKRA